MTVENFFISTAFRVGDFVKYFGYAATKMASIAVFKDERKADLVAGTVSTALYGGLTSHYTGMELENYDRLVRRAYAAEKGIDASEVKVSDYLDSKNPIIRYRAELGASLMKTRYGASLLPMLPSAIDFAVDHVAEPTRTKMLNWRKIKPPENSEALAHLTNGWRVDNHMVYAAFAALYIYEQFVVRKSGIYDASKVQETKHDVARKLSADDLIGIYNRGREDDGKEMILSKADRNAIWPILEKLADKMNDAPTPNSPDMDLTEAIYLLGLDKINPFLKDETGKEMKDKRGERIVNPQALSKAYEEIDLVDRLGLEGIADMKKREKTKHLDMPVYQDTAQKTHVSRLNRTLLDAQYSFAKRFTPDVMNPTESVSSRDPVK